jgi:hypothetical protein
MADYYFCRCKGSKATVFVDRYKISYVRITEKESNHGNMIDSMTIFLTGDAEPVYLSEKGERDGNKFDCKSLNSFMSEICGDWWK